MQTPHSYRRQSIHSIFIILIGIILFMAFGCGTQRSGCEQFYRKKANRKFVAWLKCHNTGIVTIMDKRGNELCTFVEEKD